MNTSYKPLLVLLACLLFPLVENTSSAETQNPVVDDVALAEQFVEGLAALVENAPSTTQRTLEKTNIYVRESNFHSTMNSQFRAQH